MMAEPTTTPSATSETLAACSGLDTPTPISTGLSVMALSLAGHVEGAGRQRLPLAGDADQANAVHEAPAPTGDAPAGGRSGAVGAASSTVSTPISSAARVHGPASSRGRSGRMAADTPASTRALANRRCPIRKQML